MDSSEEFLVGNPEIDAQHRNLALMISTLEQSVATGQNRDRVHTHLVMLAKYNRAHFAAEETLMRFHAYPEYEAHVAQHRQFSAALADLELKSSTQDVSRELVVLIRAWEDEHVQLSDSHLAHHIGMSGGSEGANPWSPKARWADGEDADRE